MIPRLQGNWCLQCGALEKEAPREKCKNPSWHDGKPGSCDRCTCAGDTPCRCCHTAPCQRGWQA